MHRGDPKNRRQAIPPDVGLLYLCGGILLLAFAILVVRYASARYPAVAAPAARGKARTAIGMNQ